MLVRTHARLLSQLPALALALGGLTVGGPVFAQEVASVASSDTVPALALRVEGEPSLPIEKLRSELELATGKPVTLGDQGPAGVIVVAFETDASGASRVNVVYHPPLAELTRNDTLPAGQLEGAHHIGLLAQGLIQRDAGITLLAPEPSATIADYTLGSCAESSALARPVAVAKQPMEKLVDTPPNAPPPPSEAESWRGAIGLRWGPLGFGTMAGMFPTTQANSERTVIALNGSAWMVNGTFHVDAPSSGRFKLGMEAFLDSFAIDGTGDDNVIRTLDGLYMGLSAAPSVRLTSVASPAELRLGIGVGFAYGLGLTAESEDGGLTMINDAVGYRLGASLAGTGWVTSSLGITLALGFDHTFTTGDSIAFVDDPNFGPFNASSQSADVWLNQPFLRLSAEYRL